jgi:NADPH2:quinone reductase
MQGSRVTVDLMPVMMKRLTLTGSTMRRLPAEQKGVIAQELLRRVWPLVEQGRIVPIVTETFPLTRAADAHRAIEGAHVGKIVLTN